MATRKTAAPATETAATPTNGVQFPTAPTLDVSMKAVSKAKPAKAPVKRANTVAKAKVKPAKPAATKPAKMVKAVATPRSKAKQIAIKPVKAAKVSAAAPRYYAGNVKQLINILTTCFPVGASWVTNPGLSASVAVTNRAGTILGHIDNFK